MAPPTIDLTRTSMSIRGRLRGTPCHNSSTPWEIEGWEKPFAQNFRDEVRLDEELNRDNRTVILNSPSPDDEPAGQKRSWAWIG